MPWIFLCQDPETERKKRLKHAGLADSLHDTEFFECLRSPIRTMDIEVATRHLILSASDVSIS